jgi:hypothetical protein
VGLYDSTISGGGAGTNASYLTAMNSIIAGNTTDVDAGTTVNVASSFNLIGTGGSGGLSNGVNGNIVGVDPLLTLANNGGPTRTFGLLPGSLAIDAGNNALIPAGTTTDQRGPGFARISGSNVDIGAFEYQYPAPEPATCGICLFGLAIGVFRLRKR